MFLSYVQARAFKKFDEVTQLMFIGASTNGRFIEYVEEQTPDQQVTAVMKNITNLKFIKKASTELLDFIIEKEISFSMIPAELHVAVMKHNTEKAINLVPKYSGSVSTKVWVEYFKKNSIRDFITTAGFELNVIKEAKEAMVIVNEEEVNQINAELEAIRRCKLSTKLAQVSQQLCEMKMRNEDVTNEKEYRKVLKNKMYLDGALGL